MASNNPRIPEHELTPQGRIHRTAVDTDEKIQDIAPEFRGSGATPQEKAEESKAWISQEDTNASIDDESSTRPKPDVYAQELYKRLGPLNSVTDTLEDGVEAAMETAGETKNSAAGTFSQYTQAAWDKMNELKPTLGGAKEPDAQESKQEETKQQMAEIAEKGQHESSAIAEKAKEGTSDVGHKLLAAGGDDVMKVLSDGGSTQEDPMKANMRATTEMLS